MNALLDDYLMDTAKVNNEFEEAFTSLLAGIQAEARKYTGPEALRLFIYANTLLNYGRREQADSRQSDRLVCQRSTDQTLPAQ